MEHNSISWKACDPSGAVFVIIFFSKILEYFSSWVKNGFWLVEKRWFFFPNKYLLETQWSWCCLLPRRWKVSAAAGIDLNERTAARFHSLNGICLRRSASNKFRLRFPGDQKRRKKRRADRCRCSPLDAVDTSRTPFASIESITRRPPPSLLRRLYWILYCVFTGFFFTE